jgi:hypothetical protein
MERKGKKLGTRSQSARLADARNAWRHMEPATREAYLEFIEAEHGVTDGAYMPKGWSLVNPQGHWSFLVDEGVAERLVQLAGVGREGGCMSDDEARLVIEAARAALGHDLGGGSVVDLLADHFPSVPLDQVVEAARRIEA